MITLYGGNTFCEMPISVLEPHPGPLLVTSGSKSPEEFLGYPIFFLCFKLGISQLLGPPIFGISQLFSNCNLGISQLFTPFNLQIAINNSWHIPIFSSSSFCSPIRTLFVPPNSPPPFCKVHKRDTYYDILRKTVQLSQVVIRILTGIEKVRMMYYN